MDPFEVDLNSRPYADLFDDETATDPVKQADLFDEPAKVATAPDPKVATAPDPKVKDPFAVDVVEQAEFKPLTKQNRARNLRADGTEKGPGFLGTINNPDGSVSTELSIGVEFDDFKGEIPSLVPTLTADEVKYLSNGGEMTDEIVDKAVAHARTRIKKGLSPFQDTLSDPAKFKPLTGPADFKPLTGPVDFKPKGDLGYSIRDNLYSGEDDFFKSRPEVGGMAAEDGTIILNPYSKLSPSEKQAVAKNEALRLKMRDDNFTPDIEITNEQRDFFKGTEYEGNDDAIKQTVLARIYSGDPSAKATEKQKSALNKYLGKQEPEDRGLFSEFTTGLKRGVDTTQAMIYGLTSLAGDAIGSDWIRDTYGEAYAEQIQQASENAAAVRFLDISDGETIADDASNFIRWASGGLGELVPNIVLMIAGGGIGGAAVKGVGASAVNAAMPQIGKALVKKASAKAALKKLGAEGVKNASKETLEEFTKATMVNLGRAGGAFMANLGLNTGEIYGQFIDPQTGDISDTASKSGRIFGSIGGGALAAALDTIVPAGIVKKLGMPKAQFISQAVRSASKSKIAAKSAANLLVESSKEGVTEALQELIGETVGVSVDTMKDWNWDELKPQLIEAAALGALGGTAMTGPFEAMAAIDEVKRPAVINQFVRDLATDRMKVDFGQEFDTLEPEVQEELIKERSEQLIKDMDERTRQNAAQNAEKLPTTSPTNNPDLQATITPAPVNTQDVNSTASSVETSTEETAKTQRGTDYVRLKHYGRFGNLPYLDPSKQGGINGTEKKDRIEYPKLFPDRTYFGLPGYQKEPGLPDNEYDLDVDPELLYDPATDPEGIYAEAAKKVRQGATDYAPLDSRAAGMLAQRELMNRGYIGLRNDAANAAVMFYRVPTNQPITKEWFEASKKLRKDNPEFPQKAEAAIQKMIDTPSEQENGITLNADGSTYTGGGLIVGVNSLNSTLASLKPTDVKAMAESAATLFDNPNVKIGLYTPENSRDVSVDINIIVPIEHKDAAVAFAKAAGQKSIFDMGKLEYIQTGESGENPKTFTVEKYKQIAEDLTNGRVPSVVDDVVRTVRGQMSQVSPKNDPSRVGTSKLGTKNKPRPTTREDNISTSRVPEEILEAQLDKISYKHLPDNIKNESDPKAKYEKFVEFIKRNLLYLHDKFPAELRARATLWYDGANKIANDMATKYNLTVEQVAAVMANLSPQKDWFMNVAQAEQVLHVYENYQDFKIEGIEIEKNIASMVDSAVGKNSEKKRPKKDETDRQITIRQNFNKKLDEEAKAKRAAILDSIRGKTIRELNADKSKAGQIKTGWAIRLIAQAEFGRYYQVLSPEGKPVGIQTKLNGEPSMNTWGSTSEIMKAVSVIEDGSADNVSESLGGEHKVRNFYNNIVAPNSPFGDATIDTHAVAAALLMPLGASAQQVLHNFGGAKIKNSNALGVSGTYHMYLEAYRRAAAERGIQPRQMQSITWEAVRKLFLSSERNKSDIDRLTEIWNNSTDEDTTRDTIIGQRVLEPDWARSGDGGESQIITGGLSGDGSKNVLGGGLRFRGRNRGPLTAEQSTERAIERIRGYNGEVSYRTWNGKKPGRRIRTTKGVPTKLSPAVFIKTARGNKDAHKYGASVDVLTPKKYDGYDLILIKNKSKGTVTISISPEGEVGSVTKSAGATQLDVDAAFDAAIATGRVKFLNGFETVLPDIYASYGFKPVARMKFDPQYQPEGWSYDTYRKFNDGQPDVIFMQFDGALGSTYNPEGFPEVETYDEGIAATQAVSDELARTVRVDPPANPPLDAGAQTPSQAHQLVNNVIKAARLAGIDVKVRNPDTDSTDPSFRNVGGTYDPTQRVINLALSEVVGITDSIVTLHEVVHDLYRTAPVDVQEALVKWLKTMEQGDLYKFTDVRVTDPRLRPDNPYNLAEPVFNEEQIVESLAQEGVSSEIAQGIVSDIIRIMKDLYYRVAMSIGKSLNKDISDTAKMWASNRVQALIAGQSPHLDLMSLVGARKMTTLFKNQSLYDTQGEFAYRLNGGVLNLPNVITPNAAGTIAQMNAIEENGNQEMLMSQLGSQKRGESAQREQIEHSMDRLTELDVAYAKAFQEDDLETMTELVEEAAQIMGYYTDGWSIGGEVNLPAAAPVYRFADFDGEGAMSKEYTDIKPSGLRMANTIDLRNGLDGAPSPTDRTAFRKFLEVGGFDSAIVKSEWGTVDYIVLDLSQVASLNPVELDANGNPIPISQRFTTPIETLNTERGQTNTPEFQNWFGDSKVVDENGDPLVMFHGKSTDAEFDVFQMKDGSRGKGANFTSVYQEAFDYAAEGLGYDVNDGFDNLTDVQIEAIESRIVEAYVRADEVWPSSYGDGVIAVAKSPADIKSATGNNGNFDPTDPNITRTVRPSAEEALKLTDRPNVSEQALVAKRNAMNRIWSSARQGIAVQSDLEILVDRIEKQLPNRTREEILKIIGFRKDPALEKQDILAAFAQRKQSILPEFEGEVDANVTYDDLSTEAEQTGYKLIAQNAAFSIPRRIASKLESNTKSREKGEKVLNSKEAKYEEIVARLNDVKTLEAEARKNIQTEFKQLLKDLKVNSRADYAAGEAAALLRSLMPEAEIQLYPKQFEQLIRKNIINDNTPLFQINKELMALDLDWENTPIRELYAQALEAIRLEISENINTSLSLLLSGPAFDRGDATLQNLSENDKLDKLKGSAYLATMITFVKKNKVQAQALALAQETADEQAIIMAELQAISATRTEQDLENIRENIKGRGTSALRDRLVAQMTRLRSEVLRARKDVAREKSQSAVLYSAQGAARKFFDATAKKLGLLDNWQLFEGAPIPTKIDFNATPAEVLNGEGSTIVNLDLNKDSLTSTQSFDLNLELMKQGQEIQQYLLANPEYKDTYEYTQLEERAQKLLNNTIESDMLIATSAKRDILRSSGDRVAQSGTVGGRWFTRATRTFDRLKQGYKKFVLDGSRLSGLRSETLKATGMGSSDTLSKMYDAGIAYLETERVLTGKAALDNMVETLKLNPTYAEALQNPAGATKFKEWVQASIDMGRRAVEISAKEGNLVKDTVGGQVIYRDHLNRGVGMIPRSLNSWVYTLMNEFSANNVTPFNPKRSPFTMEEGETLESFSERMNAAIDTTHEFRESIIEPIVLNDRMDLFPVPENDGVRLDAWTVRQAWERSGGDVVGTAKILAEDVGADPELYVSQFTETLFNMLSKINTMAVESKTRNDAGTYGAVITQSKFGSEARVGSDIPSAMTFYTQFSESQNDVIMTRIAGEAAFGRDYAGIVSNANLVQSEINDKANIYERAKNKHSVNGKMDKKAVKKELGSRFKELEAAYQARARGSYNAKAIIARFDGVLNSRELSADIGWFEEAHSAIISSMLQGWKTALKQLSQIYSTTAAMRSISRFNALDPFVNFFETAKAFANWPFRLFGYEPFTPQYGELIKLANLGELDQQVRLTDSMKDIGVNAEMSRDGASKFKQKARGIRNLVNRFALGKKGDFLFPAPTPFLFRPVNQISLTVGTNRILGWMEKFAKFGEQYLLENPDKTLTDLRSLKAEDLGFKDRKLGFDDASFWNNFLTLLNANGVTFDQLVGKYTANKEKGLDGLDVGDVQTAQVMAKEVFSVESMLSTAPSFAKSSSLGRMSWSLMNWSARTGAVNFIDTVAGRDILGRKQEGYKQLQSSIAGSKAIAFSLLPAALIFSLFFDWLDEEIVGKKSDVRPLLGAKDLPQFSLSVIERIGLMGPLGVVGELGNSVVNIGTGKPALSFDERVIWASTLLNIQNLVSTAISTEVWAHPSGITYNQFMRPLAQSLGLGSILSNAQVVNNLLGLNNAESRTATRINTQNALRGAGRTEGLEVRTFGAGGYSRAVPYTPHVTNMILTAMSNDGDGFNEAYQSAVRAMMSYKDVPRGEAEDRVQRSYSQRHPIKAVFKTTPSRNEYNAMLSSMSPALRNSVNKSIASFNRWGETIGVKPYYGRESKQSKSNKSLAIEGDATTLEDEIIQNIQARYAL